VLALRHKNSALLDGEYIALNESDPNVLSYLRRYKDEAVLVALNMSGEKQTVNLDLKAQGLVGRKFRTLLDTGFIAGKSAEAHSFSLEPFGVYIAESSK